MIPYVDWKQIFQYICNMRHILAMIYNQLLILRDIVLCNYMACNSFGVQTRQKAVNLFQEDTNCIRIMWWYTPPLKQKCIQIVDLPEIISFYACQSWIHFKGI